MYTNIIGIVYAAIFVYHRIVLYRALKSKVLSKKSYGTYIIWPYGSYGTYRDQVVRLGFGLNDTMYNQ